MKTSSLGIASKEHSNARAIGASARLETITDADILNKLRVYSGLLDYRLKYGGKHGLGAGVSLGTLLCLSHGSAGIGKDNDVVVALGKNS